jgi:phosphomannomutase
MSSAGVVFGSNPPIKFGTDGWRGIIADDFTFSNVCKVTRAIAGYLATAYSKDRPVLICYDTRFLADQFANTAANVLADLGWTVKVVDRDAPTPVIAYNAKLLNSAGALMFTASHNPAPYCGIKYIPDYAGPATTDITDTIVAGLDTASDAPPTGKNSHLISQFDPKPAYMEFIYSMLDVEKIRSAKLKVKYDALYSTSRGYLDEVLAHCGCETESLHTYRDVLFGGGMPEPKGDQLVELIDRVVKDKAAVGLATDGDSDRFGIVDEQGTFLTPNIVLMLLARHLLLNKGKKGAIVRTVATTHLLDNLATKYGLELIETAVGFKYVGQKMRETTVLIGGEESGGLSVIGHIPEKDGVLADMLVVEAIAYAGGKSLSQLVSESIADASGPLFNDRLDLHLTNEHKEAVLAAFEAKPPTSIAGIGVKSVGRKDGIKLYLEEGSWVLLRPSGTEPLIRVYLETDSPEKLKQVADFMKSTIDGIK